MICLNIAARTHIPALIILLYAFSFTLASTSFASDSTAAQVYVVSEGFTSFIAIRNIDGRYDAWGFAQEDWYLHGEQGFGGMLSTAVPGDAVVQRGRLCQLPERQDDDPTYLWRIPADSSQIATLRSWLEDSYDHDRRFTWTSDEGWTIESIPDGWTPGPGWTYHPTHLKYTVWWNCHDYVIRALKRADLLENLEVWVVITADGLKTILSERFGKPVQVREFNQPAD